MKLGWVEGMLALDAEEKEGLGWSVLLLNLGLWVALSVVIPSYFNILFYFYHFWLVL